MKNNWASLLYSGIEVSFVGMEVFSCTKFQNFTEKRTKFWHIECLYVRLLPECESVDNVGNNTVKFRLLSKFLHSDDSCRTKRYSIRQNDVSLFFEIFISKEGWRQKLKSFVLYCSFKRDVFWFKFERVWKKWKPL